MSLKKVHLNDTSEKKKKKKTLEISWKSMERMECLCFLKLAASGFV